MNPQEAIDARRSVRAYIDRPIPAENGDKILALVRDIENVEDIREIEKLIVWA